MIQFENDFVTLFYIAADGRRVAHNYLEGKVYSDMLDIRSAQIQAIRENTQTVASYNNTLVSLQLNVDAGRGAGIIAPPKPLQKVVADTGDVTFVPFVPPLTDLVIPAVGVPTPPKIVVPVAEAIANQQAVMYNMILAMFRKMFPEA